jgi:hypothetical protein
MADCSRLSSAEQVPHPHRPALDILDVGQLINRRAEKGGRNCVSVWPCQRGAEAVDVGPVDGARDGHYDHEQRHAHQGTLRAPRALRPVSGATMLVELS